MKIAVRYYTQTGNTTKLANAIGEALDVEALTIETPVDADTDILFLGSAVYGAGIDDKVKDFIKSLDSSIGTVVNFSSSAILPSTYKQVKKLLDEKNIKLAEEEFFCRGKFTVMHRSRPNQTDIENAKKFARDYVKNHS